MSDIKRRKLLYFLARGGDIYSSEIISETGLKTEEASEYLHGSQEFKMDLKRLQDQMHYDAIRRLKASTPVAAEYLIAAVTSKKSSASTASINAAKILLGLSGVGDGTYEDAETLNPTNEEIKELIKSIPRDLRYFDEEI